MKKIAIFSVLCLLVMIGVLVYDYGVNNRCSAANLHRISLCDYQEEMQFSAPIQRQGNLYLMSGAVRKIDNVTVGAVAGVSCNKNTYEGYLWRLEPTFDGIYYVTVSVTGIQEEPPGLATATLAGNIRRNLIFIPEECLVTDEFGQDGVFVVYDGYAMLRQVEKGTLSKEGKIQIQKGLFQYETVIVAPHNIRTGDRILPR